MSRRCKASAGAGSTLQSGTRWALSCLLAALSLAPPALQAQSAACGAPAYDPAGTGTAIYVWQDCPDNDWHVRATSGNGWQRFEGGVEATQPFTAATGFSLEGGDVFDTNDPSAIIYRLGVSSGFQDGFDFSLPSAASGCFRVQAPAGVEVRAGSGQTPVAAAFDLATLGACGGGGGAATLSVGDVTVDEWRATVEFVVRLAGAPAGTVTVDFRTVAGTATADEDFIPNSGSLTFSGGTSERTVIVDLVDETLAEGAERFSLELSNAVNADIAEPLGVATIRMSDGAWACGPPAYDAGRDRGAFLWRDCNQGRWHLRATAGGSGFERYTGTVTAAAAISSLTPVSVEPSDTLVQSGSGHVEFSLGVYAQWQDGFDFATADNAGTCFGLSSPADTPVRVGPRQAELASAFDLRDLAPCEPSSGGGGSDPLNVVVLFTDDQRFSTLPMMPTVRDRLMPQGVAFENAYVPTPLCCPARASVLSGGFLAQNTGVLENEPPNGGSGNFDDSVNIGTRLQQAGYRTLFVGKWQNDYPLQVPRVPPGWDQFVGRASWAMATSWSNFRYLVGSSGQSAGVGTQQGSNGQYHVYHERDHILDFIETAPADEPFMVFWATTPPHPPADPAAGDETAFADFSHSGRGVGETDLSDKPQWVQTYRGGDSFSGDAAVRSQLRSMLSVDRSLGAILDALNARGELDETVFILTSDNGYMWGEHGLWGKNFAYEESIRVPLLVVMPGIAPRVDRHLVSAVLDLGPTLYDIAGISAASDGRSLLPLLENPAAPWREELFFEKYGTTSWVNGLWAGLRRGDWKYVRYYNGEEELYNLATDPFELENRAADPGVAGVRGDLATRVDQQLGLSIKPAHFYRAGTVGQPYRYDFDTFGGVPPFAWEIETGSAPPGLTLDPGTGVLAGTPTQPGTWVFTVRVTDSQIARQSGALRTFVTGNVSITIR